MVKSLAENCRDYRKRLKEKDNEGYMYYGAVLNLVNCSI